MSLKCNLNLSHNSPQQQSVMSMQNLNVKETTQYKELEEKFDKIKKQHEIEKKLNQKLSLDYSIKYYKDRSNEMVQTYTNETTKLFT